ncbi:MAG: acyl--CoA ligase [Clostridia bacterium]|nr:acyl--CoA ligase [Clostridia bacterium]
MRSREEKEKLCNICWYEYLKSRLRDKRFLFTENKEWTAGETVDIAESLAEKLYDHGVRKGSLVGFRTTRCTDTVFIMIALHIIGAVSVLTDAHSPVKDYIDASKVDIAPDFYITNEDACGGIDAGGNWILRDGSFADICLVTFDVSAGHTDAWARETASHVSASDPTMIIFTSGSTGKSKAVLLSQKNHISHAVDGSDLYNSGREDAKDTAILVLPLHHIFGVGVISNSIALDFSLMVPEDASPEATLRNIDRFKITVIYGVPTYLLAMAESDELSRHDLSSMAYALISGGPSSAAQAKFIEKKLGLRIIQGYGMTECLAIAATPFDASYEYRTAGVGIFFPMNESYIIDENGNPVHQGEEGEILVRSNCLMLGYYNDPEETAKAVDGKGYLHTGDIGYQDKEGILHISGRKKDIIIRGGNNLSAGKIEETIMSLPCVHQAVVAARKDEVLGEVPCAAVMPAKGYAVSENELRAALEGKLTKPEMPVEIRILDELPLTSSGKADRVRIKEMFNYE